MTFAHDMEPSRPPVVGLHRLHPPFSRWVVVRPVGSQWAAAAPPFTDFLRVVRDEGPSDYTYLWMIDLLSDDPRVFFGNRRVETG